MAKVIIFTNENGGVSLTTPTAEYLENNTIEDVLAKDCPDHAIIVDDSELPEDHTYFNAWELVKGKIVINLDKKNAIDLQNESANIAKQSALAKLKKLGLTEDEVKSLLG